MSQDPLTPSGQATLRPTLLQAVLDQIDLDASGAALETLAAVADVAIEIAREGREGRRIGTLFTVGAESEVLRRSRCLILDPLAGHPAAKRSIHDPDLRETVKELAQLDGGFVISRDGTVLSACRYFEATLPQHKQPLGGKPTHRSGVDLGLHRRDRDRCVRKLCGPRLFERSPHHRDTPRDLAATPVRIPHREAQLRER